MTPQLLLALWRDRWGKPVDSDAFEPFAQGSFNQWFENTGQLPPLTSRAAWFLGALVLLVLVLFIAPVASSLQGQWTLTILVLLASLMVRRYQSEAMTLVLLGFAMVTSTRYLFWRWHTGLITEPGAEMYFSLGVWAVELYGFALWCVSLARQVWPVAYRIADLPEDVREWPKVSVFIVCFEQSLEQTRLSLDAVRACGWPPQKVTIHLLDNVDRLPFEDFAATEKVRYVCYQEDDSGRASVINRALAESSDSLVALIEAGQQPDHLYFLAAVAALESDENLGVAVTAHHFLIPSPPQALLDHTAAHTEVAGQLMLLRRRNFMQAGGVPTMGEVKGPNLLEALDAAGASHLYLTQPPSGELLGVAHAWVPRSLTWRLRLDRVARALGFYRFLPVWLFVLMPWIYFVLDLRPWKSTATEWLAYVVPYVVQGLLLHVRMTHTKRRTLLVELRELLLMVYIQILTAFTALWTLVQTLLRQGLWAFLQRQAPLGTLQFAQVVLVVLNTWAFWWGVWELDHIEPAQQDTPLLFLAWSLWVCLLIASRFAIKQETLAILDQQRRLARLTAALRLPSGKTLTCETENFPDKRLQLRMPMATSGRPGQGLQVALASHLEEFAFQATLLQARGDIWDIQVQGAFYPDFDRFVGGCYARGPDWPAWLPGSWVDRILPHWMIRGLEWPLEKISQLIVHFDKRTRTTPIKTRTQP
jgi:cellulose synthase (UDP-forming)